MATVPHNYSFLPAGTSLSPAFSSTDSAAATTTFPPAGRASWHLALATGWAWGPQLLPGVPQLPCAQLLLGMEPEPSPGTQCLLVDGVSEHHCHTKPCWAYTKAGD